MTHLGACPHFPRCGGCRALDTPYSEQLTRKTARLADLFSFAALPSVPGVIPSPREYHYRHKVQLPFGQKKQGKRPVITLGCYGKDSHEVIDQRVCLIQDPELSRVAWSVRDWAQNAGLSVYDERTGNGFLRHVLLRKGAGSGEILLGLVTNGPRPPGSRRLADTLLEASRRALAPSHSSIVGIVQNVNTRATNVVLGEREFTWWGRPFLFETLGPYRFKLGLSTFFQVNPSQTPRLYDEALTRIGRGPRLLDCYCGVGSISLWVSKKCSIVTGIEENGAAVAAAKKAAEVNGTRNVRFIRGDIDALLPEMAGDGYDTVIFDPPRKGLGDATLASLRDACFTRIVYISCNPDTLARDVRELAPAWKLTSLQGVDMFPHTEHVEAVAALERK